VTTAFPDTIESVERRYASGEPAILRVKLGKGSVTYMGFSPSTVKDFAWGGYGYSVDKYLRPESMTYARELLKQLLSRAGVQPVAWCRDALAITRDGASRPPGSAIGYGLEIRPWVYKGKRYLFVNNIWKYDSDRYRQYMGETEGDAVYSKGDYSFLQREIEVTVELKGNVTVTDQLLGIRVPVEKTDRGVAFTTRLGYGEGRIFCVSEGSQR
jgi:hypothetical protein